MKKVICFGEIMLRLSAPGYSRLGQAGSFETSFGGGEANVAVSLSRLGTEAEFVSAIPDNDIGDTCLQELQKHGVSTSYLLRQGGRLGIYFLEKGASYRASKVIYDRAGSAFSELKPAMINWNKIFEDASWFHWTGITPALSETAAQVCKEALDVAVDNGITISCDLNYRSKLWNYGKKPTDVMPDLVKACDIIMGNEEDAIKTLGIEARDTDVTGASVDAASYHSISEQIMQKFPKAKKVITSLRGSISASHNTWSGVLYDGQSFIKAPNYDIAHIVDRIGAGDAFMAGIIYGMINNMRKALNSQQRHLA